MVMNKLGLMGKVISLFLTLLILAPPALAQTNIDQRKLEKIMNNAEPGQKVMAFGDAERGKIDGKRDGKKSVKHLLMIASGCSFGIFFPLTGCVLVTDASGCTLGFIAGALLGLIGLSGTSKPSPSVFVCKSPEYITAYAKEFRNSQKLSEMEWYSLSYGLGTALLIYYYMHRYMHRFVD